MPLSFKKSLYRGTFVILVSFFLATPGWALAPASIQGDTLIKLIETLEKRHYDGQTYDDSLSDLHLHAYIDALDPQKMFFTRADVDRFLTYRDRLDDLGRSGDLSVAFTLFNQYHLYWRD